MFQHVCLVFFYILFVIFVAEQYVEHFTLLNVSVYTHKEYTICEFQYTIGTFYTLKRFSLHP